MGALRAGPSEEDVQYVRQALEARGGPQVPHNFEQTAPGHDGSVRRGAMPQSSPRNPQVSSGRLLSWCSERRLAARTHNVFLMIPT